MDKKIKIKIAKNISWLLFEHGIRIISGIVAASILARVLGVENYGIYNYILGLVIIFQSLSFINPAEIMVPRLTNANSRERQILMGNGFAIRMFFSIIAYIALLIFVSIFDGEFQLKLAIVLGIMILFGESFGIVTAYLQSQTIIKYRSVLSIISAVLKTIIYILLYIKDIENIYIYAFIVPFEWIFLAIGLTFMYKHLTRELFFKFNFVSTIKLLKEGIPFFISIVFMCIFWRLDLVMMRFLTSEFELGIYSSAIQLLNNVKAISPILAISFAPLFVYKFNDLKVIKRNVFLLTIGMTLIALATSIILYFLAPFLINLIFGDKFESAIKIFQYFLFVLPLIFANEALNIYIIKMNLGKIMIYKWLIVLIGAFIAYMILIPKFGSIGAIIGYGVGYALACIFGVIVMVKNSKIKN